MNGVIRTSDGILLRAGYVDFFDDRMFDPGEESFREDVPVDHYILGNPSGLVTKWNGRDWEVVEDLETYKLKKQSQIDARTRELISHGFWYKDEVLSLSLNAQQHLAGLAIAASLGIITEYPISINTLDNRSAITINNNEETIQLYSHAVSALEYALSGGTELKQQVRNAFTRNEVDAVKDDREWL